VGKIWFMSQPNSDDADALLAESIEPLLDLGLPADSKLTEKLRPLARELLSELDPKDTAERMLAVQMVAVFSRSMYLARAANAQKNTKWFSLYSGECDRAMTQFRRQVQTLKDLRRPRRSFTAIRNANIAGQQIVVTQPNKGSTPHCSDVTVSQKTQASLPPQQNRSGGPDCQRPEEPPVGT
jgi:hypothetical protein